MKPVIVLQTDFGPGGGCTLRGTCLKVDPELDVYDSVHTIEQFSIRSAARYLHMNVPYWPEGTIFVSVVDPGVGTSRRACAALLKNGSYVVTPDNGSLTKLLKEPGIEAVRSIDETKNRLKGTENVSIFHGRDLFAYCAAKLASGIIDFEGVGPEYPVYEIVTYDEPYYKSENGVLRGIAAGMMKTFGNLETSIPVEAAGQAGLIPGEDADVSIFHHDKCVYRKTIPFRPSFGWVEKGSDVIYNSSDGVLGLGINLGDFVRTYGIGIGEDWIVEVRREEK